MPIPPISTAIKPEWDTPANGDFASYVERLSARGVQPGAQINSALRSVVRSQEKKGATSIPTPTSTAPVVSTPWDLLAAVVRGLQAHAAQKASPPRKP